jgi:DNA-binding XRE family transcriptional regulator
MPELPPEWAAAIRRAREPPSAPEDPDRETALALRALIDHLRRARIAQGLTVREMSRRLGLSRGACYQLELNFRGNPTWTTLHRYARALGLHIVLSAEPPPADEHLGI